MTSDDLFDLGVDMSRIAAGPRWLDAEPITLRGLINSVMTHLQLVEDRLTIPLYRSIDNPVERQNIKVAANCCQTAIEQLKRAIELLPDAE